MIRFQIKIILTRPSRKKTKKCEKFYIFEKTSNLRAYRLARTPLLIYICFRQLCFVSGIKAHYECKTVHSYSKFYISSAYNSDSANLFVFDPQSDESCDFLSLHFTMLRLFLEFYVTNKCTKSALIFFRLHNLIKKI